MRVPQEVANLRAPAQFSTGSTPGMTGTVIPASAQASRNRRKVSASKKNCVIASEAPASILRLSQSISARSSAASGCFSG